ncbi:hypothetical protein [Tenacibaculum finnmarkense]|uniref:hypothetical protein n=1 Tax=Tenacibaculum finnmarkense TaxID=2781243 RepID=UPI001EFA66D5|nr:hypothetical protein [Tenacibaculum finnmarkense]MCG8734020.1 hypothetical protein [Tenacibaculum finnmarkense]
MSNNIDYKAIKKAERKIGRKASKMIESRITQQLRSYGLIDTHELEESVKTRPVMGELRLFRISTKMERHGYILQQGISSKRTGHTRHNEKSKLFYTVKEHRMMMQGKSFITEGIEDSGAFQYLFDEIGKLRMKEIPVIFNGANIDLN